MPQQENLVSSMVSMSNDFSERKAPADDDDEGHLRIIILTLTSYPSLSHLASVPSIVGDSSSAPKCQLLTSI